MNIQIPGEGKFLWSHSSHPLLIAMSLSILHYNFAWRCSVFCSGLSPFLHVCWWFVKRFQTWMLCFNIHMKYTIALWRSIGCRWSMDERKVVGKYYFKHLLNLLVKWATTNKKVKEYIICLSWVPELMICMICPPLMCERLNNPCAEYQIRVKIFMSKYE